MDDAFLLSNYFRNHFLENGNLYNRITTKLNRNGMIPIVLSLQNKFDQANSKVLEDIRKLNDNSVIKQANSLL